MNFRAELHFLQQILKLVGFNINDGQYGIKVICVLITCLITTSNTSIFVICNWDNIDIRVDGLKQLSFIITLGMYYVIITLDWNNMALQLQTIFSKDHEYPFQVTVTRNRLMEQNHEELVTINTLWRNGLIGYVGSIFLTQFCLNVSLIITRINYKNVEVKKLLLVYPFYYPENYENLTVFFCAYAIQTFLLVFTVLLGYVVAVCILLSMGKVIGELRLLRLSLQEMDETLCLQQTTIEKSDTKYCIMKNSFPENNEYILLKSFIQYFVNHHVFIYRQMIDVNKGIQLVALLLNTSTSIYLCMGIYTIARKSQTIVILIESLTCCMWLFYIYSYDKFGEKVSTEGEYLRLALYNLDWINKPQWFKKSLLIIMARSQKTLEINPLGLFVLNLRSFTMIVNAAYSYYNVLVKLRNS